MVEVMLKILEFEKLGQSLDALKRELGL